MRWSLALFCVVSLASASAAQAPALSDEVQALVRSCFSKPDNAANPAELAINIGACTAVLNDNRLSSVLRASVLEHRGVIHRNGNYLDESVRDLIEAQSLAPNDASILRMLAWTYRTMGRPAEAEQVLDTSLQLDDHFQGHLSRCVVRYDQENYAGALQDCEVAKKMDKNEDSYYLTALVLSRLDRSSDAIEVLGEAIRTSITSGRIYGLLAHSYHALGQESDAAKAVAEGRKAFPNDLDLQRSLETR
jgi:tetratricopeptide (TPR) repeat protein